MPLTAARSSLPVACAAMSLLLTACTPSSEPTQLSGWDTIVLPRSMVPSTLLVTDDQLLIGGSQPAGTDRAPALAALSLDDADAAVRLLPVTSATPYGKVADLVFLTGSRDGGSTVAVGAAHGGAHANFRWTIWTGHQDRLVDRPQTFETFGGWEAGTLLGLATDARGPLVIGTWQGRHGADGAVWRADGERWVRQPATTALTSTATRQVAPQTVSQQPDGSVVVNGSVVDLTDGVRQAAAYWRDVDGTWSTSPLPDPGTRSLAWSTACASSCWTVGERDDAAAVWTGDGLAALPPIPVTDDDRGVVLLRQDRLGKNQPEKDQAVVPVSSHGSGLLLVGGGERWRAYTAPAGRVLAAQLVGTRLYLVTGSDDRATVSVRDLADVLGS